MRAAPSGLRTQHPHAFRRHRPVGRCPKQLLPVSSLAAAVVVAAEKLFFIRNSGKSADFPELLFHSACIAAFLHAKACRIASSAAFRASNPFSQPSRNFMQGKRCAPPEVTTVRLAAFPAVPGSPGASGSDPCCAGSTPTQRHQCTYRPDKSGLPPPGRTPSRRRTAGGSSCRSGRSWWCYNRSSIPDDACCAPCGAATPRCSPWLRARPRWGCGHP